MTEAFTFNDILLVPKFSNIERGGIDTSSTFCGHKMLLPVLSSPMDTVTGFTMVIEMRKRGALGIYHRYEYDKSPEVLQRVAREKCGMAVSPSMSTPSASPF